MTTIARLAASIAACSLILAQSPAHAAAAKASFFACKDEAVFKKAFQRPAGQATRDAKEDKNKVDAYFKAKMATGECLQLARGEQLSVDQRDNDMWCVRPSGGLDCYWTLDKAIDLDPSTSPSSEQPHRAKNH